MRNTFRDPNKGCRWDGTTSESVRVGNPSTPRYRRWVVVDMGPGRS